MTHISNITISWSVGITTSSLWTLFKVRNGSFWWSIFLQCLRFMYLFLFFLINLAYNFALPFCEYGFISSMFIRPCVNTTIKTLHDPCFSLFPWNAIVFPVFFYDPQVSSYYMLVIFVYKIRPFSTEWQNRIILKKGFNILDLFGLISE